MTKYGGGGGSRGNGSSGGGGSAPRGSNSGSNSTQQSACNTVVLLPRGSISRQTTDVSPYSTSTGVSSQKLFYSTSDNSGRSTWETFGSNLSLEDRRKLYLCGNNYITPEDPRLVRWSDMVQQTSYSEVAPPQVDLDSGDRHSLNDKLVLFRGDITHLEIDAIVNAANERLLGGGGVDGSIHRAAGPLLKEQCRTFGGCPTGNAVITKGYKLPASHVIHTVGPIGFMPDMLRRCYENCFQVMLRNKLRSIAFCCISTGIFGFPNEEAAQIALDTTRHYLTDDQTKDKIDLVIFCCFLEKDYRIYNHHMATRFFPPPPPNSHPQHSPLPKQRNNQSPKECAMEPASPNVEAHLQSPRQPQSPLEQPASPDDAGAVYGPCGADSGAPCHDVLRDPSCTEGNPPSQVHASEPDGRNVEDGKVNGSLPPSKSQKISDDSEGHGVDCGKEEKHEGLLVPQETPVEDVASDKSDGE